MTGTNPTTAPDTTGDEPTTGGSEGTSGEPEMVSYTMDIQPIWEKMGAGGCVASCHVSGGIAEYTTVLLDAANSYATTVDKTSPSVPTLKIVAPGSANDSYLWHKINDTFTEVGGVGTKMPQGGSLSADELALVKAWIDGGALP